MNRQRAMEWIANGEVGISSKTMWSALMGVPYDQADFPYDADDFRRCWLFAQTAELLPVDFEVICQVYPWWRNIYEIWHEMDVALANKDGHRIYELINEPKRYARLMYQVHGMVKVGEGSWMNEDYAKRIGKEYEIPE